MNIVEQIAFILFAYLLGAIPFGYLLTRYYMGKNIMKIGSGNIGSTNVKRVAGKKISLITQLLDMLKGFLPVLIYYLLIDGKMNVFDYFVYIVALATIIGHDFSIFLKFKGGKGVNTTLGTSVLIAPFSVFIAIVVYLVVKWQFKYVSLGSIFLALALPISELIIHQVTLTFYYLLICAVLIIILHYENIKRLLNDRELSS